jgi:hypothetical protein
MMTQSVGIIRAEWTSLGPATPLLKLSTSECPGAELNVGKTLSQGAIAIEFRQRGSGSLAMQASIHRTCQTARGTPLLMHLA